MDIFVARQPIFDQQQKVYAYELLFRSSLANVFSHADPNQASSTVMSNSFFMMGIDFVTGGKKAFLNLTKDLLVQEYVTLLPKEVAVVEILETVDPTPEVIEACKKLKAAGYLIALDDFVDKPEYAPLLDLADIIKVDVLATNADEQRSLLRRLAPKRLRFLAEKVETHEVFQESVKLGFTYFQGYFFSKPVILAGKDVPAFKLHYLDILRELRKEDLNFRRLEELIKKEMSLTYKLLRYINSAAFALRQKIDSIQRALMLLGEREVRRWLSLLAMAGMGKDKPEELVIQATIRAKFCELLAPKAGVAARAQDFFFLGLFSMIDAILEQPLADALSGMPIAEDVKAALLGEENFCRDLYECVLVYERGEWERLPTLACRIGVNEDETPALYAEAVQWTQQSFQGVALAE
jgi:EAL and modified HD-GYP domain-containing signal transduction protein